MLVPRAPAAATMPLLPLPMTPLLGRQDALTEVTSILQRPAVRLLTLTGMDGVGKTRLAVEVAALLRSTFADAVCFVPLAAARFKILSPAALLARLVHRLQLLTDGALDLPERQQTLCATLDWSHGLLVSEEQILLRRVQSDAWVAYGLWIIGTIAAHVGDYCCFGRGGVRCRTSATADPLRGYPDNTDAARVGLTLRCHGKGGGDCGRAIGAGSPDAGCSCTVPGAYSCWASRAALYRALGDRTTASYLLGVQAWAESCAGRHVEAVTPMERCLGELEAIGDPHWIICGHMALGDVLRPADLIERAQGHVPKSMLRYHLMSDGSVRTPAVSYNLHILAAAAQDLFRAVRLLATREMLRQGSRLLLAPCEWAVWDVALAQARQALGQEAFDAIWAEGAALSMEAAIGCAPEGQR